MSTILEAKAVISAQDKTGATFDQIAKKLNNLGKSKKAAEAIDRVSQAMGRARDQLAAIERFNASGAKTLIRQREWKEAERAVASMAREMRAAGNPTKQMLADFDRVTKAASAASHAFEKQRDVMRENKRALAGLGVPSGNTAQHQKRVAKAMEFANKEVERQERLAARSETRRLAVGGAFGAGSAALAHGVKSGGKAVLHTYREFDRERRFGKAVMGLTDDEQKPLVDQAIHMGATTKFNDIQVLEAQRELAARGVNKNTVLGMMQPAGSLGMALDLQLPDAVKQMEGAIFGFKKKIDTEADALAAAKQTADLQVKAAKLSGMTPEDISQAYKYGATPARLAGLSESTLLAFAGISKKANMGGDESGVAFRALVAAMQSPTAGAKTALLANGLDFKNYQRSPDSIPLAPFTNDIAAKYGVKLNKDAQAALAKIFSDKATLADPALFAPAVSKALGDTLGDGDAKSKKSIAGAANRYRNAALGAVDSNAFFADLLQKIPGNLPLANALFGAKQGGRIATALGDPETMAKILAGLRDSDGYADKIAGERMAGFDGAVSRFEGAIKNLETAIGRGFDADGKGGALSTVAGWGASATQWLAERDPRNLAIGAGAGAYYGLVGAGAFGYGFLKFLSAGPALTASAVALNGAAAALTTAAGGGVAANTAAATAGAGTTAGAAATGGVFGRLAGAGAAALPFLPYTAIGGALIAGVKLGRDENDVGLTSGERMTRRRGGSVHDAMRRSFADDRERLGLSMPDTTGDAMRSTLQGWGVGNGTGGAAPGGGEVKAVVEGQATLEATVTVSPSPYFLSTIDQRVDNKINAFRSMGGPASGTTGSTGRSMPEAGSPQ